MRFSTHYAVTVSRLFNLGERMTICSCNDVTYEMLLESMKKHGDNISAIQSDTDAGTSCECCLEKDCDIVDLAFHEALEQAKEELKL